MLKSKTHQLTVAGLMVALGLILPFATSHAFGVPGTILLPMHIPVLLCGLFCGPYYGAIAGLMIPVLSSVLTNMPALYPMLPIMAVQLCVMGTISGILFQQLRKNIYLSLLLSMLCGWVTYGLVFSALLLTGNGQMRALSVFAALAQGVPGIAIQLVLIPLLVAAIRRYQSGARSRDQSSDILRNTLDLIRGGGVSCVVIHGESIVHTTDGRGVSPLLKLYREEPEKLKEAFVVDKIIGKAAAMILVLGGASKAYGMTMSAAGLEYLQKHGITAEYGRCVDVISNRERNGICPIERSVLDIDDPFKGYTKIEATIAHLMNRAV